ncbi:MAG: D-alanyl-D-alanine carboxypeptidase/D-alanyl-D-alanine-endopeptidase [Actinomycetaceae bacterium]|nr:D-alanyl-D-alanine carboxypeptidase/D-alanyl-D-alanine-endopeptidase [Actinomycetaceae bacterium]
MRKSVVIPIIVLLTLIAGAASYVIADIYDKVPGILTMKPPSEAYSLPTIQVAGIDYRELTGDDADTPMPDPQAVQARIEAFQHDVAQAGADDHDKPAPPTYSIRILDTLSGKVLAQSNADTELTPASTNKVFSAIAALKVLGPKHRFTTQCQREGSTIYLVGGGDQLLARESGNGIEARGYAGVKDLAVKCAAALHNDAKDSTRPFRIALDDTIYSTPREHPDWYTHAVAEYGGPVDPLAFDTGRVDLRWSGFYSDPAMEVGKQFLAKIKEAGVEVEGDVVREKTPDSAKKLADIESATVEQVVDFMLTTSNNVLAENMCFASAVKAGKEASFEGGTQTVRETLSKIGIDTTHLKNHDCSGLSVDGKANAQVLTDTLQTVAADKNAHLKAVSYGLPIAGLTGTLDKRFLDLDVKGTVRAKTGSLPNSRALAGFLRTQNGRTLTFAFIINSESATYLSSALEHLDKTLDDLAKL